MALEMARRAISDFSFLTNAQGEWEPAPAYDLTFAEGPGGHHSLSLETLGPHPSVKDLLAIGAAFQLERKDCLDVLDQAAAAVARWSKFAAKFGVPRAAREEIGRRLKAVRPGPLRG